MNTNKLYAQVLIGLGAILAFAASVNGAGIIPTPWSGLIAGICGVAGYYNLMKSHTPAVLGAAGYVRTGAINKV